jgi:hypothetical protein
VQFVEENGEGILYVEVEGKRVARRRSGEQWVNIEPGYTVRGCEPGNYDWLEIESSPADARLQ